RSDEWVASVVPGAKPDVARAMPEERSQGETHRPEWQLNPSLADPIRVRQRNRELVILVPIRGSQEERWLLIQFEGQAGQVPCPVMVQDLFALAAGLNLAEVVEQSERVAVFENTIPIIDDAGSCQDVVRIGFGRSFRSGVVGGGRHVSSGRQPARIRQGPASRAVASDQRPLPKGFSPPLPFPGL